MSAAKNGGPAFPVVIGMGPFQQPIYAQGMTLRDAFAIAALQGLIAEPVQEGDNSGAAVIANSKGKRPTLEDMFACAAYAVADAMIAERAK